MQLFTSESQEVQRFATGATRNLIYENMDNKTALMEAGGISALVSALREPDEELRKNITGKRTITGCGKGQVLKCLTTDRGQHEDRVRGIEISANRAGRAGILA